MKLFLASEAKHQDTLLKLDEYIGGIKNKKIAYIPTAANGDGWGSWNDGGTWSTLRRMKTDVTVVELEKYRDESIINKLQEKDLIWMAGGECGYLMYWIRRTQLDIYLKEILNKDTVYVGSSAGSMICGQSLDAAEWYFTDNEHGASVFPTLKLVDFDIYPHFEDELYDQIKENYKGKKLYLLKNGEEIIVEDDKVTIIGTERVIQNI